MKRTILATLLLTLALLGVSALAAGSQSFPTHLRLSARAPAFHGNVKSSSDLCRAHRLVKMLKKKNGPDKVLGTDRSNHSGDWEVDHPHFSSGIFYAKVTRGGSASLHITCEPDKSRPVVVD